jgi:hypothetical protein
MKFLVLQPDPKCDDCFSLGVYRRVVGKNKEDKTDITITTPCYCNKRRPDLEEMLVVTEEQNNTKEEANNDQPESV